MNNPRERGDVKAQRDLVQSKLEGLEKQDSTIGPLISQAESLMNSIGELLGNLSHEYCQARTTFLFLADTRSNIIAGIQRLRIVVNSLDDTLKES